MNLPPFSHAFYSSPSYHPSVSNFHSPPGLSSHIGLSTSFTGGSSAPPQQSGFGSSQDQYHPSAPSITSPSASTANSSFQRGLPVPASGPRGPHNYSESPRLGPGPLSYSSSPGMHHLSPTSPTTQMMPPGLFSHSTNSSSASSLFPNALRTPGGSKRKVERPGSVSPDAESWDESDKSGKPVIGEETDEQPWGMPQDQYKSLNPRDKKQVRNRIGARRFRAKRKGQSGLYVSPPISLDFRKDAVRPRSVVYKPNADSHQTMWAILKLRFGSVTARSPRYVTKSTRIVIK